jgi:branched-chain amino acid transport system substrate-binding protein
VAAHAFWATDTAESKKFVENIKSKFGVYPEYAVNSYAFTKAMAKAINKVGSLDTEKVIDALEGAMIESPVGPVEIRACDHQSMWPSYVGLIGQVPGWDFYASQKPIVIGREAYQTCEEIAKRRKK